jgi:hypothetical protein
MHAKVGDELEIDSAGVGTPPRKGAILEVHGDPGHEHYRVRWEDGHESLFFPAGTAHLIRPSGRASAHGKTTS